MPSYTFRCSSCRETAVLRRAFSVGPTAEPCACGGTLEHDLRADVATVELDTAGCRDHNVIAREKRVFRQGTRAQATKLEGAYGRHVKQRRQQLKEDGNKGTIKQSHAIPADLYHGKIRETGDKQYWQDKKNVDRHSDFKVG